MKQSTARAHPRSSLHMLRIIALALTTAVALGNDCDPAACVALCECTGHSAPHLTAAAEHSPACTEGSARACQGTAAADTRGCEAICTNDTRCLENCTSHPINDTRCVENCVTRDTQGTEGFCCNDGPQMNPGFNNGCQTDSNPCCIEYRYGNFVYYDPLWTSNNIFSFGGGGYVPPSMPASSRGGYSSQAATRPDWETSEWTCVECQHVNHPCYNPMFCDDCGTVRPEQEQPTAAPAPANVDPLMIESLPAPASDPEKKNTCCVCMERVSDIVLLGPKQANGLPSCRHKCMCRQCARRMRESGNARCPMCRTKVEQFAVVDSMPRNMQQTIFE